MLKEFMAKAKFEQVHPHQKFGKVLVAQSKTGSKSTVTTEGWTSERQFPSSYQAKDCFARLTN